MTSWFHKTKRWWETTPPSLIGCSPGKSKRGNDGNTWAVFSCRHLHMCGVTYVFQVSGSPWWWALGVQSSAPGSLRFWFSSAGRGKGSGTGPPLHPRCPERARSRWTGRSPELRPAGSQSHPTGGGSFARSVQTLAQDSAPCPSCCCLTQDGWWCGFPILCDHYLLLCWIRHETCTSKIGAFMF